MKIERRTLVEIRFELAKSSNDDAQRLLDELDSILFDELCEVVDVVMKDDEAALGETLDRAVEDMTTKELIEGPAIQSELESSEEEIKEEGEPIDRTKPVPGGY